MKKLIFLQLLVISLVSPALRGGVRVLPTPKFVSETRKEINFQKISTDFDAALNDTASLTELKQFFGNALISHGKRDHEVVISARIIHPNTLGEFASVPADVVDSVLASDEGYFITSAGNHISLFAKSKTGVFYAVTTFLQIVEKQRFAFRFPEIRIADYPSMKMRGISDDISRGQISTVVNFRKIIRFLAMYKMNVYMPYIENVFEFKSFPNFSAGRAPLTTDEVAELDDYARLYHVRVIPIFETLGHMEDVLQKPDFERYAEFPGAACIDISSHSAYAFMKNLLSEIAPAFSSEYFNMAADESFDVGLGASKRLVDSVGVDQAHAQYYRKIYGVLKSLGKEVMMYGDIILKNPNIMSEIPKDITIVDWQYGASFDFPTAQKFKDAGFRFVVSPAVWNFTGPFPNFYNSYANIEYFARVGSRAGAVGMIVSSWNDNGAAELRELNYPGYAWGAECAWNPESPSSPDFEDFFFKQYFRTNSDLPRIIYELLSSPTNQISWYEFWRAPFIDKTDRNIAVRAASIQSSMPEVLSLIESARRIAGGNQDILDLYGLVARMNIYWADKVAGINKIRNFAADSSMTSSEKRKRIMPVADSLIAAISRLKKEYAILYLRTNRHPMLQLIESRFDDQKKELIAGTDAILSGNSTFDQILSSKFIYFPSSRPYTNGAFKVDSATFVKTIDLARVLESDTLQLIGDTYCRLFINGDYVGEVQARRTLTWNVEKERVRVFDVSGNLRRGQNTLLVQAMNFDNNGSAGCNVFARIGDDTLQTDSTWKVAKGIVSPDSLDVDKFTGAVAYDNGWPISAPKFSMGMKSWIER
jgi:hypothetical protein